MVGCQEKEAEVERIMEDGVEVIVNHIEPYEIKGEFSTLHLEEEFTIDTEKDDLVKIGLTDILCFDIDSEGSIYVLVRQAKKDAIYKFDQKGNFITTFGRMGQGPGEIVNTEHLTVGPMDDIIVTDPFRKLLTYDRDGNFKKEVALKSLDMEVWPLKNGNYLVNKRGIDPDSKYEEWPLILCDSELEEIKELDRYRRFNWRTSGKFEIPSYDLVHSISNEKIYVGNSEKGYEIREFDLKGNLEKKIRKEYQPVEVSEEFKKKTMGEFENPRLAILRDKIFFPKYYPPFQYFFTDDGGHLFVMTNERSEIPGEYIYDIFNSEGLFISRISLGNLTGMSQWNLQYAKARNKRLYCLKVKENEYKELMVYRMIWK
jgi:hypothetical protein